MIIWLPSYPRSGNTFLRILMHHFYGFQTYSGFNSGEDLELVGASELTGHRVLPPDLMQALKGGDSATLAAYQESTDVYIIKSHMTEDETGVNDLPAILLVRDPRDALVSSAWYSLDSWRLHMPVNRLFSLLRSSNVRLLRAWAVTRLQSLGFRNYLFRSLLRQEVSSPRWSELNNSWMDRIRGKVHYVRFEDLIANPQEVVQRALLAVGANPVPVEGGRVPDFAELHKTFPSFFRQGKIGKGRQYYSHDLYEDLLAVHGATMKRFGYSP
jgi:Sulfotransferase domain